MSGVTSELAEILAPVEHILLDFDGPVCAVFAGMPAPEVSRCLLKELAGRHASPSHWGEEADPLALLRRISDERPDITIEADEILTGLETEAALLARPTPDALEFLTACAESSRAVHVVSNNSGQAIRSYLAQHQLGGRVTSVFGRVPGDPTSMKPDPRLLLDAMAAAGAEARQCVFVGDAVRDVQAGDAAAVRTIGYANKPGKREALTGAGAVAVVDRIGDLVPHLR